MAPNFRIEIFKRYGAETWDNSYLVSADTLDDATVIANALVNMERAITNQGVIFEYFRVATLSQGDRVFTHVPLGSGGTRSNGSSLLPLFNTLRVDLLTTSSDPGRKYYRGVLEEADINFDGIAGTSINEFQSAINAVIPSATAGLQTPAGNDIESAAVNRLVQMRQLHRKRRRATTP
jgi:hypothetical protein